MNIRSKDMVPDLIKLLKMAEFLDLKEMTPQERIEFETEHPGVHIVVGDFEIRCTNPERYHL